MVSVVLLVFGVAASVAVAAADDENDIDDNR